MTNLLPLFRVRPDVKARRIRFDLCGVCDLRRSDPHHRADFRMVRTPYDFPGHVFVDPADLDDSPDPADLPAVSVDHGRCGSGWTGDRCSFPLFHDGPHSNGGDR